MPAQGWSIGGLLPHVSVCPVAGERILMVLTSRIYGRLSTDGGREMDVETYRRDGFLVVKDVFAGGMQEELQALRDQLLREIEAGSITRQTQFIDGAIPELQGIALRPPDCACSGDSG